MKKVENIKSISQQQLGSKSGPFFQTSLEESSLQAFFNPKKHTALQLKLDVSGIKSGIDTGKPVAQVEDLIGHGAKAPAKKSKPDNPAPEDASLQIRGFYFPAKGTTKKRALVFGGFHGEEIAGYEIADALVDKMKTGAFQPSFHTIVVPRVNPGGIMDDTRCNRQYVDLNRNFKSYRATKKTSCDNDNKAPVQPEIKALKFLITTFKPDRIASAHTVSSAKKGGIFVDPNAPSLGTGSSLAIDIAKEMAKGVDPSAIPSNLRYKSKGSSDFIDLGKLKKDIKTHGATIAKILGKKVHRLKDVYEFDPVYPGDKPGKYSKSGSLGSLASGKPSVASALTLLPQNTPIITLEVGSDFPLSLLDKVKPGKSQTSIRGGIPEVITKSSNGKRVTVKWGKKEKVFTITKRGGIIKKVTIRVIERNAAGKVIRRGKSRTVYNPKQTGRALDPFVKAMETFLTFVPTTSGGTP